MVDITPSPQRQEVDAGLPAIFELLCTSSATEISRYFSNGDIT